MNTRDIITIPKSNDRPLTDACTYCGTSRFDSLHSNYKGCRFCRQHWDCESIGMGGLSDKYCAPLGPGYDGDGYCIDGKSSRLKFCPFTGKEFK